MKYDLAFIRSKVARRVILLFFLSSLLPIAAIAFFSFTYITDLLTNQAYTQLQHSSKLYGMAVMDRLTSVDNELDELSKRLEYVSYTQASSQTLLAVKKLLHGMAAANPGQVNWVNLKFVPESNLGPALFDPSGRRKSFLFSRTNTKGNTHVFLLQVLGKGPGNTMASVVAELNNEYVWGDKSRLPFSTYLCVMTNSGKELFCPNSSYQALRDALDRTVGQGDPRKFNWQGKDGDYLGVAWDLFINSRFSGEGWKIISSRSKSDALLSVIAYRKIFPLVIVFALLIVLLLSTIQVRRIMLPLERLVGATRRLARYEFGEPVKVNSKDEFSELGESFNIMALRLEKQLNVLKILSDIDHLILTCPDPEVVLARILETADRVINCQFIAVYLFGKSGARNATLHIKQVKEKLPTRLQDLVIPGYEVAELDNRADIFRINLREESSEMFAPLARKGVVNILARTVLLDEQVRAVFCLCYRAGEVEAQEDSSMVSDIIDRLAVTLATADRDEKLYRQAHFDFLTGLPNRQLFNDRLEQHIIQARRKKERAAVLYVDLDRFKTINDSLGHASGDNLLRQVSERMRDCVRETDTVSRLGSDEFVILLANITSPNDAGTIAENVIKAISRRFFISAREIFINTSIGIAIYPDDGETNKELLAHADAAMYHAKAGGRGTYKFFEEDMNQEVVHRVEMETAMRHALDRGEFELYYQPQIDLRSGRIFAIEALIRWQHPTLGKLMPTQFIPLAEDSGLIEPIGEWVLYTACHQYMKWRECGIAPARLAVNISSRQFMRENFIDILNTTINESGMSASELELEITESLLLNESLNTRRIFDRLDELGVRLAIDDFGTGYSSLSYLKQFAVQTLKIDRAFTRDVPDDEQATTLTLSIIAMAHALNMQVVAEGVEKVSQLNLMKEHRCDFVQGNYFAKALSTEEMSQYLEKDIVFPKASTK